MTAVCHYFCHNFSVDRSARLHAISEELRRVGARGRTADQLASMLEVATRTVKRDIAALQVAGVPIAARTGPGGGYTIVGQPTLPPVNFTAAQAVALAAALAANQDAPFADDGRAALAKLLDVLDPIARARVESISARVWVRGAGSNASVRRAIEQGIAEDRVVSIGYVDGDGARTDRRIEPHMLAYTSGHWFVLAWCRSVDAPRWFRLDRIGKAAVTRDGFEPRDPAIFGEPPPDAFAVLRR